MAATSTATTPSAKTAAPPCVVCGKSLSTASSLKRHLAQVHQLAPEVAVPAQRTGSTAAAPPAPMPPPPPAFASQPYPAPYPSNGQASGAWWPPPPVATKAFYKKKRFYIPVAVVTGLMIIGSLSPQPDTSKASAKTPVVATVDPTKAAADRAAAATAAAAQAAAEKAAAVKRAADAKAAAAQRAADAKAAAAKAAAERAAAKKAAAEKAARERPVNLTSREFALLMKNPDAYVGRHFIVYGEVTQFDAATGDSIFRANSGAVRDSISYGFTAYSDNTLYLGDTSMLANVVEGDVFKATIEVLGSESYDTQIGGNTTVPKFRLQTIAVYGSTQ
jgi:hypothetical protein